MEIVCAPETYRRFESSSLRQKRICRLTYPFFVVHRDRRGFEGGSRFARAKRFALRTMTTRNLSAKSAINNCRAGRAAKGANPLLCAKKDTPLWGVFLRRRD